MSETAHVREPTSKRLRFEVFKRDCFACVYCGRTPPTVLLECDHVDPVSNGGLTEIDNLVTACFDCNRGKADRLLTDIPQGMAVRAAEVLEREEQIAGFQAIAKQRRFRLETDASVILNLFCEQFDLSGIPREDYTSIKRFVDKLGLDSVVGATDIAFDKGYIYKSTFRYFCAVCWNRVRDAEART